MHRGHGEIAMPKIKTNRGAAKRFRATKNGKFKRAKAYGKHLFTAKSPKRRRNLRQQGLVSDADWKAVRGMLPYL
jgi:large subunit ribosomal protein L35